MAVPKYNEIMPYFIKCLGDEKVHNIKEIREFCVKAFNLSDEDRQQVLPCGKNMFTDRVGWAKTYLQKAGLIESPSRANYQLTAIGIEAFSYGVENITLEYLKKFDSFKQFFGKNLKDNESISHSVEKEINSPTENIEIAFSELNEQLANDLMTEIMKISPYEFESLVVKLLIKMGYGNMQSVDKILTKKSNDEGIDGIVTQDKLGFDSIYIQAKQWKQDSIVGRPEIQKFLGALAGQGATRGLFITTSRFSSEAISYVNKQLNHKIVLVDGKTLTSFMIRYNLGVSVYKTYDLKRIDMDFFNEDI
ncbi:MAG: restriction endonuclease [Oscillospiraceae bacterium]|nr:restriction endonuclease [Oscillospiraceae bacterium]